MAECKMKPGQDRIQVVDGPFAGKKYQPGRIYNEIPPEEAHRFEEVVAVVAPTPSKKAKKTADEEAIEQ